MADVFIKEVSDTGLILKAIKECDSAFDNSIISRADFDKLYLKVCKYSIFLVAYIDEKIVGYLAFYANDSNTRVAFITLLAVKCEYQNLHIGKELLITCESFSKIKGMEQIKLEVQNKNLNAIRFYKNNGYKYDGICSNASQYMKKVFCNESENK